MSLLARIHAVCVATIVMGSALLRIALGLMTIWGCVWWLANGFNLPGLNYILGIIIVWGLVIVVTALGVFVGAPSPDRNARRETRRALRRARMLRRW
jgi:hypothetical protein